MSETPVITQIGVLCPECGTTVDIDLRCTMPLGDDGLQYVHVEPDMTDLWAHAWTHDE